MKAVKKAQDGVKVKKQVDSSTVTDTYNPQRSKEYQNERLDRVRKSEFDQAFAAARKAGKETFMFKGKSYNTKLKGEGESRGMRKTVTPLKRMKTGTVKDSFSGDLDINSLTSRQKTKLEDPDGVYNYTKNQKRILTEYFIANNTGDDARFDELHEVVKDF